ncbi:MAG TPA: hypothetical protein VFF67_00835 [Thermoplasmata archaeon]|nr:hypothetical protein [Thermoplasmata archaeon]
MASRTNHDWVNLTNLGGPTPGLRTQCSMAYDARDGYVVLFGGSIVNDTWTYVGGQWTEHTISGPSPRALPGMVFDAADGYLLLFGGAYYGTNFNDTWKYVGGNWTRLNPATSPPSRWAMSITYDATDSYVLLYGGISQTWGRVLGDTWAYRNNTWSNLTRPNAASPGDRGTAALAYDEADRYSILFGGYDSNLNVQNGTWKFVTGNWSRLSTTTKPSPRCNVFLEYDPYTASLLLFGGDSGPYSPVPKTLNDTWSFGNGSWTQLHPGHSPRSTTFWSFAWDSADRLELAYDGHAYNSTWSYGPPVVAYLSAAPSPVDLGQSTTIRVDSASNFDNLSYAYSGLPAGCGSSNATQIECTPNATGTFPISVNLSEPTGVGAAVNTTLVVDPSPAIASFVASPDTLDRGQRLNLSVVASGGTGTISYSYSGLPPGCPSRNTTNLMCFPSSAGSFIVTVKIVDGVGASAKATTHLSVTADPAAALVLAPSALDLGQTVTLNVTVRGGTGIFTFGYSGLPPGCPPANAPSLTCRPNATGAYGIHVAVTDGAGLSVNQSATLTVYTDPIINSAASSPAELDLGQTSTLGLNVSGGSGGYAYNYTGLPAGCSSADAPTFSCTPNGTGSFLMNLEATDSLNWTVRASATLVVNPDPAVVAFVSRPASIDLGQSIELDVTSSGGTGATTSTYSGLPLGCSGSSAPVVNCSPRDAGEFSVRVTQRDAVGYSASATALVTVNPDPTLQSFTANPPNLTLGENTSLVAVVAHGTGYREFAYSGLPAGCASRNVSTLTCAPLEAGTFIVTVVVTDAARWNVSTNTTFVVSTSAGPNPTSGLGLPTWGYPILAALAIAVVVLGLWAKRARHGHDPDPPSPRGRKGPEPEFAGDDVGWIDPPAARAGSIRADGGAAAARMAGSSISSYAFLGP